MEGLVITKNANLFTVECDGKLFKLMPSGKTKANGIFVGDKVKFSDNITSVCQRKNLLIRPPVANIDKMFVVVAPIPKPDFTLVDKIIVYCHLNDIQPIIVINKTDICDEKFIEEIETDYKSYKIIKASAKQGLTKLIEESVEGICTLAGQSAVGKSSLVNAIFKDQSLAEVGDLSAKVERGKQTTRMVNLYRVGKGYLADTAGFSLLDLAFVGNIEPRELASYYPDFLKGREGCKYRSCQHKTPQDCGVCKLVKKGEISKRRYENYLKILQEIDVKKY